MNRIERIKASIRDIPDFPKKEIIFKDITPVLKNPQLFSDIIDLFAESVKDKKIDFVAGIEARGFIFGGALALKLNRGFIPIRKPGKLPYKTYKEEYQLEYGTDAVEMHQDAVSSGSNVLLIDDLLATGGTALAAAKLIEKCGALVIGIHFLIELAFLNGKERFEGYRVHSLIEF